MKDCDEHRDVLDQKCDRERCKWEVDATTSSGAPISKVKKTKVRPSSCSENKRH